MTKWPQTREHRQTRTYRPQPPTSGPPAARARTIVGRRGQYAGVGGVEGGGNIFENWKFDRQSNNNVMWSKCDDGNKSYSYVERTRMRAHSCSKLACSGRACEHTRERAHTHKHTHTHTHTSTNFMSSTRQSEAASGYICEKQKTLSQLSPLKYSTAQSVLPRRVAPCRAEQRRSVPCRAVPLRAVLCQAVSRRAAPCRTVPCRVASCRAGAAARGAVLHRFDARGE